MPLAIISNRYNGANMAKLQAIVAMLLVAVPTLAPSLSFVLMELAGLRAIFLRLRHWLLSRWDDFSSALRRPSGEERRRATRSRELLGNVTLVLTN